MAGHFGFSESPEFPEFRLAGVPLEWLKGGAGTTRRSSFLARVNIRGEESFFGQEWNLGPPFGGSVSRPPKRKGGPPKRQTREETRRSRWDDDRYRSIFGWENGISTHPAWCGCGARPYLRSRCPLRAHTLGLLDAPPKVVTVAVVRRVATARRSHATLTPATRPCQHHRLIYREGFSRTKRMPALVPLCPLISRKRAPWLLNRSCRHVAQNQEPAPSAACSAAGRVWKKVPISPWISDLDPRHTDGLNLFGISNETNGCSDGGKN